MTKFFNTICAGILAFSFVGDAMASAPADPVRAPTRSDAVNQQNGAFVQMAQARMERRQMRRGNRQVQRNRGARQVQRNRGARQVQRNFRRGNSQVQRNRGARQVQRNFRREARQDSRQFRRQGSRAFYRGHRGYRYYRPGYRRYNGFWFPSAAFLAGTIITGTSSYGSAHVQWCYDRYRSYRAYDNTFQPYNGPRRQCYSPYD